MTSITPLSLSIAAALAALALGSPAYAQAPPADPESRTLDTLIVTAQRRAENVQEVPVSISVVETQTLRDVTAAAPDTLVLGSRIPSVHAESSFGRTFPRFYIRGLGNTDFDLNANQPISMVYDDVVLENPTLKGFPIFDLDRIEVLRGPQGTLFGRNTPGGVLKFESVRPDFDNDGYVRLGVGRFDLRTFEAAQSVAINESSAFRVSALYQNRGDVARNTRIANDERGDFEESALRAQWLLRPNDDFEALLQVRARNLNGGSAIFRANAVQLGSNRLVDGLDRFTLAQDARADLDVETLGGNAKLSWDFGGFRLLSISAYESVEMFARGDVDGGFGAGFAPPSGPGFIPFPAESGDGIPSHRQLTQELRLESASEGPTDWQLGVFWFDEDLRLDNVSYDTLSGSLVNGLARQRQETQALAVFGSVGYALDEQWRVGAGLRYTQDDKKFVAERLLSPIGAGALAPIRVDPSDNNLSGDLNLNFAASENVNLYARIATAYRAPSIQGRLLFGDVVSVADSEEITSFEIGSKAELWDRRARLGFSLYRYDLDDAQLTAVGGAANFNTLINAQEVRGDGAELDLEVLIGEHLTFSTGLSYNRTEINDDGLFVQPCGSGCSVLDAAAGPGLVSIDGNSLPQAPRRIANVALNYVRPIGAGELQLSTDWSHRSEVNFFLYDSLEFTGPALTEGGVRIGYGWANNRYQLSAYGRNITDRKIAVGGVDFNNLTVFLNEPRSVGLQFEIRH
ncbi:MAG: TonB-dependent receptor [Pseudomarimonas sp.]